MDYNELAKLWNNSDLEIEKSATLNRQLLKEVSIGKVRSSLAEFKWGSIIEIAANYFFSAYLLNFMIDQYPAMKYFLPALLLLLVMLAGLVFSIYKLFIYFRINSNSPVLQTQKNIEKLKYFNLLEINILYVVIPLFSSAFLIVIAKAIVDFDLYIFGTWLILNTIASFVIAVIVIYFLKKFPDKKLQKTLDFLREINEAEK